MITPDPDVVIGKFFSRYNGGVVPDLEADMFAAGVLTSLVAMQLVRLIEQRWMFELPVSELRRDNFRSIGSIRTLIERNVHAGPAPAV